MNNTSFPFSLAFSPLSTVYHVWRKILSKRYVSMHCSRVTRQRAHTHIIRQNPGAASRAHFWKTWSETPAQKDCNEEDCSQYDHGQRHVASVSRHSQRHASASARNQKDGVSLHYQLCQNKAWYGCNGDFHVYQGEGKCALGRGCMRIYNNCRM